MRMEYIVMLTAISNKKLTKLVATRPSQKDSPIFPSPLPSLVCKNCGQVHDYLTADEYVDFYENRYRMKRKSVYHRKYHIINVMDNIAQINGIQIGYYNREKILRIFRLIDNVNRNSIIFAEDGLLV